MAKNNGALADDEGNYPDWIELHNPTDKAIGLKGYSLTDDSRKKGKFVFPEMEIGAGDYLVVFASGTERVDAENRIVHMPFSINSQKEDIVLYDPHSREISRVEVRDLPDNTTCGPDAPGQNRLLQAAHARRRQCGNLHPRRARRRGGGRRREGAPE